MRLNRNQAYLIGLGIIIISVFLNRFYFLIRSEHVRGEIVDTHVRYTRGVYGTSSFYPVVKFTVDNYDITFTGEEDSNYMLGDKVDVIYLKSDLTNAKIYNLNGFWLPSLIYGLIPFFCFSAFVYSFMNSTQTIKINLPNPLSLKRMD